MKFTAPSLVEQTLWDMRQADLPRGINRAQIERLFNGLPPWSTAEADQARIKTNVNWLEAPKLAADARRSYSNAFLKPGIFFTVTLDHGPVHKRATWAKHITQQLNKQMKKSLPYFELLRSQFALTVLHGIGPAFWDDDKRWCPSPMGIEDVLVPSDTRLTMDNLSYFGVFRRFTAMELYRLTHGHRVDPAWNMPLVDAALDWVNQQTKANNSYADMFQPQKVEERFKQDLGFYGTDAVPTVDAWDFYFWSDEDQREGWRRRMVLDTPYTYEIPHGRKPEKKPLPNKNLIGGEHGEWLYDPGKRVYANKISEIIHFQFGDASAVAPFRYHSVRSLGWLLYAVCHLQNRLRCKFNDAVFESMLQYIRTSNPDDKERIIKIDLHDLGVVPEGVEFVKPQDRWLVNQALVNEALVQNRAMMDESAAQYREGRDQTAQGKEKTATQIMAEVNAANALVGSMLMQAYQYQTFQYMEIARRFCVKDSPDPDVREFRKNVLKAGVPETVLDVSQWEIAPERVMGAGNKTLELAIADKLMAARPLMDPESQREVLHLYVESNSDNSDLADRLVPMGKPRISDSVHDAQLMMGTLMQGLPVTPKKGQNASEVIETLLVGMAGIEKRIEANGAMATPDQIAGLGAIAQTIGGYIGILAQDESAKDKVKQYSDDLGKLTNVLKGYEQRLQEQMKMQQSKSGNGEAEQAKAKAQATMLQAQVKAKTTQMSHAQRMQQRQQQHMQKMKEAEQTHRMEMAKQIHKTEVDTAAKDLLTAAEIRRGKAKKATEE